MINDNIAEQHKERGAYPLSFELVRFGIYLVNVILRVAPETSM